VTPILASLATRGPVSTLGPDWLDPDTIITNLVGWLGPWAVVGVCAVIFAETGLLVGFFLPGDSLLFTLGMFVGSGDIGAPLGAVLPAVFVAAVVGNSTGYLIGHRVGPKVFDRPDSRFFKREYVDRTHAFFERHGGKAIVLAQFVPIVRPFTPVAAGVGRTNYRHFVTYNLIGALLWAVGVTSLGYWLGGFAFVQHNIEYILIAIVLISVTPMIVEAVRKGVEVRRAVAETAEPEGTGDAVAHEAIEG
jgi:membrane-associated protein